MIALLKGRLQVEAREAEKAAGVELEDGAPEEPNAAIEWFQTAVDKGDTNAMFKLGNAHARGDLGLDIDFAKAGE